MDNKVKQALELAEHLSNEELVRIVPGLEVPLEGFITSSKQQGLQVKIKKLHPDAVIPQYAKSGDAGMDFTAISVDSQTKANIVQYIYGTGIAVEIPDNHVGLLFPRSSVYKTGLSLSNCVGVIDSGYRGEIKFIFNELNKGSDSFHGNQYIEGDKIGQMIIMPFPKVQFVEVEELGSSDRGDQGWGSSGR